MLKKFIVIFSVFAVLSLGNTLLAQDKIILGTAGQGGTWYVLGSGIANVVSQFNDGLKVSSSSTRGSIENLRLVATRRIDIGMTVPPADYWARNGQEMFKGQYLKDLRFVCGGHLSVQQTVVPKNSPIKTIADLRNKRAAIGVPGSGTRHICGRSVLWSAGLEFSDLKVVSLNQSQGADALIEGSVDATHFSGGLPNPGLTNLSMIKDVRILPINSEDLDFLFKNRPYLAGAIRQVVIKAGTYKNQTEDIPSIGFVTGFIAHKDLPEDIVYKFIKTIYEHRPELSRIHRAGDEYTLKGLASGCDIPAHPGSIKFFKEHGIDIKPSGL